MVHRKFAGYLIAIAVASLSRGARAGSLPASVLYRADPDCPTVDAFLLSVRDKASGITVTASTDASADVVITLRAVEGAYTGRIEMRREHGMSVRDLVGPSCEEAASALAFVLALALRPGAEPEPPTVVERRLPTPLPAKSAHSWWGGLSGGFQSAPLPGWSFTGGAFVELRLRGAPLFTPAFALGFMRSGPDDVTTAVQTTRIVWTAGRLSACPVRVHLGGYVGLAPCLGFHAGAIAASGMPVLPGSVGRSATSPWVDVFGELHLEIAPIDALTLRFGVEVIANLTRYDFAYEKQNIVVLQTPAASAAGSLAILFRFW